MVKQLFWKGFLFGCLLFIGLATYVYNKYAVQPDVSLTELTIVDTKNKDIETVDFVGKPLVVNFWATWCKPCVQELPHFKALEQRYGNKVTFIFISDEDQSITSAFAKKRQINLDFYKSKKPLSDYGINALPATFFYNSAGELIHKQTGSITANELEKQIKLLLQ